MRHFLSSPTASNRREIASATETKELRETLLDRGRLDFLYAFQNEKRVFAAAHHAYKQAALVATRGGRTEKFLARFRMGVGDSPEVHEIADDLLRHDSSAMVFTPQDVRRNSPRSLSLVELRTARDLAIFRKIYDASYRIGDKSSEWEFTYVQEFNMTSDSKRFPSLEQWEAKGYRPDVFGRWIGPEGQVALPLYQGGMIHQFDCFFKKWLSGSGKSSVWEEMAPDSKVCRPQFLMSEHDYGSSEWSHLRRIGYRRIAPATNTRSFICTLVDDVPTGDSVFLLIPSKHDLSRALVAVSLFNSLTFDFIVRQTLVGSNLSWFIIENCPIARSVDALVSSHIACRAAKLTFIHRRFAHEWIKLKGIYDVLGSKDWKYWWAITGADRLRLRVEIDALVAHIYGLDYEDFQWIVRDDRRDTKGFYRVDRQLPFRERLTGLAAAAFRALKDGRWSAESAANLSNDEFFDLLGIPELTNAEAAKAKGLPGPLILKRDSCHQWNPENFPEDDPRYGWTWEHCWKDAVALLGSEEAVQEYIEGKPNTPEEEPESTGPKDLFGDPIPEKLRQKKLF